MVFKRRDRRSFWRAVVDYVWPRGGWARAFEYVKHRVRRLPDTPERISRGIWAGVFVCFTPLFGLHFVIAAIVAKLMRGNLFAALAATFFGNPLTFPAIGYISIRMGSWLLGMPQGREAHLGQKFANASITLGHNLRAIWTSEKMTWRGLHVFYDDVFFPYAIGGIVPGVIAATVSYYISVQVIGAYQNRRRKALRAKLGQLRKKSTLDGDAGPDAG